jgi:tRNA pseudouridine13 synthase
MGLHFSHEVKLYSEDNEQFVQTDMEKLKGSTEGGSAVTTQTGDKLAVVLKFQLGSSQYATMALRELTKGLVREYKPDLGGGR